jgi:indole-3-glycerol phosphate synthase
MNILNTIVEHKKGEVSRLPAHVPDARELAECVKARGEIRDFTSALGNPRRGSVALIAEVKKASPSAGVIRPDFDPVRIAQEYEAAGADCLSVLTDQHFFQGSLEYLKAIRTAVRIPLLRKDFIIDERQIAEAIEWGADAILLIAAILTDGQLRKYHDLALGAGLSVLVEIHDEFELDRALAIKAKLIGVNNRNLKTFQVDLATTERLASRILSDLRQGRRLLVAESGIHSADDVRRLATAGACAVLVGESLMRNSDLGSKVSELMGDFNHRCRGYHG